MDYLSTAERATSAAWENGVFLEYKFPALFRGFNETAKAKAEAESAKRDSQKQDALVSKHGHGRSPPIRRACRLDIFDCVSR